MAKRKQPRTVTGRRRAGLAPATRPPTPPPGLGLLSELAWVLEQPTSTPLDRLQALGQIRAGLDAAELLLVDQAREQGASWGDLGVVLLQSRQAVRQRVGRRRSGAGAEPQWCPRSVTT